MARVYVIDDDAQLLRMVGLMLERGGHNVTLINDPIEGLEQINAHRPDVLILDVMMPGKSGHDVTRELRETKELEGLPILILTARSQDIDRKTALKSGADDYLSKPVTSQELMDKVDQLLTKKPKEQNPAENVLLALYGFRGGVGQSTLAVNIAGALRRMSQKEVCLVDFSINGGQLIHHLRLQPRKSSADFTDPDALDWSTLKEAMIVHPSGLHLLPAPILPHPTDKAPSVALTSKILTLLKEKMLFTVVDLPTSYNDCFKTTLSMAYMGLQTMAPDVVSVKTAVQTNQLLAKEGINIKYRSHILNQTTPETPLTLKSVERGLNNRVAFHIGYDANQPRALVQGVPLTLTSANTPIAATSKKMAEAIWQRVMAKQGG